MGVVGVGVVVGALEHGALLVRRRTRPTSFVLYSTVDDVVGAAAAAAATESPKLCRSVCQVDGRSRQVDARRDQEDAAPRLGRLPAANAE